MKRIDFLHENNKLQLEHGKPRSLVGPPRGSMLKFDIFKWELVGVKYWEGKKLKTFIFRPLSTTVLLVVCDAEMRIFICIKSVKVRYICPANQQFFCDDENPFFYGSIKKSYLVPHGRMKLMICPQDYDDYHHKIIMESQTI